MSDDNIQNKLEDIHTDVKELRVDIKDHLSRISGAEADIGWLKGHVRMVTVLGISVLGTIIGFMLKMFGK